MAVDPLNPYKDTYVHPNGPGDARPTGMQVLQDADRIGKWQDKVILITGGTSGIGVETVRAMYATGAHVFITARDLSRAKTVTDEIIQTGEGSGKIDLIEMNLERLDSVKNAVKEFLNKSQKLNVLINNAG
jgi:NAD(P)-dependent dehydrogenase (short-subunit alcohol dehydrogenase family)